MESNSNNDDDFKHTAQSDNYDNSSSRDSSFSSNSGKWPKTEKYHSLNHNPKDDWNRDRNFCSKDKENFQEKNRRFKELPQQPTTFPPYACNTADHSCVDYSQRAVSIMPYTLTSMNNNMQCDVNPVVGMPMPSNNMTINFSSTSMPMATGMEMTQHANNSMNPSVSYMGMVGDNMFGMMGTANYYPYGMMNCPQNVLAGTVKELVNLTQCILYPPKRTDPIITRSRPKGCKTVYVGRLPEKVTEEIIKEVFERCGEICKIRMNAKNFCHVRFTSEEFVDRALNFSGYTMKIENKDDPLYTGRIHVDYAEARDDAYDYKCKQRGIQREARHRQRDEVSTSPPVVYYSKYGVTELTLKLKKEETYQEAVLELLTWLKKGECNRQNAGKFFTMIKCINSHVMRLISEKVKYEDEVKKAKAMLKNQMQGILVQFNKIEKLFNTASLQKVQDHFTKGQRQNIKLWKKLTEEIKNAHVEEVLNDRVEDEMDICEDEEVKDEGETKENSDNSRQEDELEEDINKLENLNDVLRCQVEAAENELMVLRSETLKSLDDNKRAFQGLMRVFKNATITLNQKRAADDGNDNSANNNIFTTMLISESDARLLCLLSSFLHLHPNGATIDYIHSYVRQYISSIQPQNIEKLLKRFPTIYIELDLIGISGSLEKNWISLSYFADTF